MSPASPNEATPDGHRSPYGVSPARPGVSGSLPQVAAGTLPPAPSSATRRTGGGPGPVPRRRRLRLAWRARAGEVAASPAAGFAIRTQIIWDKTRLVIGRGDYHWQHEPALYCVRRGRTGHWGGGRNQTTVWSIPHRRNETGHGTQKPVECMRRPIENNSSPGQAGCEPFSGSGTTLIAAEITGGPSAVELTRPTSMSPSAAGSTSGAAVLEGHGKLTRLPAAGQCRTRLERTVHRNDR